jgi:hypothetical protein
MSSVPPNLVGPILQTPLAQRQVSAVRGNEDAQRASAARKQGLTSQEQASTVETTDSDTQIHTDAEGTGSQGRAFSEQPGDEEPLENAPDDPDEGRLLDLEA